jgi:histidinol-phosphatase
MLASEITKFSAELDFALDLMQRVGAFQLSAFRPGVAFKTKSDASPVTEIDERSEEMIRDALAKHFPEDDILGEEQGSTSGKTGATSASDRPKRKWLIDPIDGTVNFIRGIPIFATLLALEEAGEIIVGVIHAPAMGDTFWAEQGKGAFKNGTRIFASQVSKRSEAQFHFGEPKNILAMGMRPNLNLLIEKTYRHRAFGDYLNFAYVFEGKAEGALEIGVKPWDLAPMQIIALECGGKYSDLCNGQSIYTGNCLVSNSHLHDQFLALLQP